jgi:hypothetical protein
MQLIICNYLMPSVLPERQEPVCLVPAFPQHLVKASPGIASQDIFAPGWLGYQPISLGFVQQIKSYH